ncbi:MAG: prepilin-type N-terminal cleavage/methylation domain-containing protein [Actinomycetota bacterium]|nr:prepilin-type N-terminal cleavage/methylation domain-containing protein [Actinomycetota bacterium]
MQVRPHPVDDDGFSLMEVVVAAVVLALATTVLAGLFIRTLGLAQSNTQRTTAANLATQQIEKLQTMRALDIPDSASSVVTVAGTTYTITQTSELGTPNGTACNGTGAISSKRVTVIVDWPNRGNVQPVRSDSIRALGTGSDDLSDTKGAVAVAVQNAGGNGTAGISVTLKTAPGGSLVATQNAGPDGCAVFADLVVGNYTATVNTVGYVNLDGTQASTSSGVGVTASTVSKVVLPYDLLGGLSVTPTPSDGSYGLPVGLGVTLTTSIWSPSQNRVYLSCVGALVQGCVSGSGSRLAASLFPANYGAWAGTCADAAPGSTPTLVAVSSGSTPAYTVSNLGLVNAVMGTIGTGKHLYAVHASDASCPSGEIYDLGVVSNLQTVKVALPYGLWRMQLTSTGNVVAQSVTLKSTIPGAQTVSVLL